MSKNKTNDVDKIAKDIAKIAKALGIEPSSLTKAKYFANTEYSEWQLRKFGGFNNIRNTYFQTQDKAEESVIVDNRQIRSKYNKLKKDFGERELYLQRLTEVFESLPKVKLVPYKASKSKDKGYSRTVNLMLSDLHIGSDLVADEHLYNYGVKEEARALAKIVKNVCDYKREYRDNTELVVNIAGDVIENNLHDGSTSDYLHIQTCRAIWLLKQVVSRFAENFPKVRVNFAVGNHGRDKYIHPGRATDMKYNSVETTIYYGVKMSCAGLKNVTWDQPLTPWVSYEAQGHRTYVTHGDTHLNPGNLGKIDVKSLESQTNKINAQLNDNKEYKVFVVGHVHQATVTALPNGAMLIVNGALTPPNAFAQSLNIMECQQIQVMWESTKDYPVGDFRFISVNSSSQDGSLDKIITPFPGLNVV